MVDYRPGDDFDRIKDRWDAAGKSPNIDTLEGACSYVIKMVGPRVVYVNSAEFQK